MDDGSFKDNFEQVSDTFGLGPLVLLSSGYLLYSVLNQYFL